MERLIGFMKKNLVSIDHNFRTSNFKISSMASNLNKNDDSIDDGFIPYRPIRFSQDEMGNRADNFKEEMNRRRSVRCFSRVGVPIELIRTCIEAAGTAPSGANKQPWSFCIVGDRSLI